MVRYNCKKRKIGEKIKFWETKFKKMRIKNFDKIYNKINECDIIFSSLTSTRQEQGERSNEKVCVCALGIDSKYAVWRPHCTQGMWPFHRSWEKFNIDTSKVEKHFSQIQSCRKIFGVSQKFSEHHGILISFELLCFKYIFFEPIFLNFLSGSSGGKTGKKRAKRGGNMHNGIAI